MAQETVKVGIIGAGGNTRSRHIPGLQAIEGVEIVGVCNRSQESSQRVADEFGIPKTYGNWQDAIADPDTNAIDRDMALYALPRDGSSTSGR